MSFWVALLVGIAVGFAFGAKALAIAPLGAAAWWVAADASGHFVNRSGNGDNLGAEAILGAVFLAVVGIVGVSIGAAMRALSRRWLSRPPDAGRGS